MVNKKAWLRIVEASIAIMLVFGVIMVMNGNNTQRSSDQEGILLNAVLGEIAKNTTLREEVLIHQENESIKLYQFLGDRIDSNRYSYDYRICPPDSLCGILEYPLEAEEIYTSERIISSNLEIFRPKKIKVFIWKK